MTAAQLQAPDLSDFSCSISDDAYARKADALALSKQVTTVANAQQQQDAIAGAALCKSLIKGMRETRETVKAPVLAAGRLIDQTARDYSAELEREMQRLEMLASKWQEQENRKLAAIRAEQERKNREAEQVAEAERRAFLDIIAKADADSLDAVQRAADEAAERNAEAARERHMAVVAIGPAKVEGARVTVALDYEVMDIRVLADARPDLVAIEPKRALLLVAIQLDPDIPGLRVYETTRVSAKS